MTVGTANLRYPRLCLRRALLRGTIRAALGALSAVQVEGREHLPRGGPLLVVANHFHFLDPLAMIHATPWPLEFLAGSQTPNAPRALSWLRQLWGVFPVHRGAVSRRALRLAESVLNQEGVVGVFPEGGSWAAVLRPPRPGSAYLAARTGAPILPMGFSGITEVFPALRSGRRARVVLRIGEPFGPFEARGRGPQRREQLQRIGDQIMRRVAKLLPEEQRGHYASDPELRAAAREMEAYPWDREPEL